jgi:membrane protease subunit HflC
MTMRIALAIALLILVLIAVSTCAYTVDRAEYVYVTQFGRHLATHDGARDGGLHWKLPWPIQSVQRVDARLQYFDLPETELLTHDSRSQTVDKTITVVAYVCWRIADTSSQNWSSVDWFIRRVGKPEQARTILDEQIRSRLGAAIGRQRMDFLFNTDGDMVERNMRQLRDDLLDSRDENSGESDSLREKARNVYGIEIVDIRLRRTSHPVAVRDAIFKRIRSERDKRAAEYRNEGSKIASEIKSTAERRATEIRAEGQAKEKEIRGQAEAEADRIRNEAHAKDPEFYAFLKKLEEYQRILGDNKTVLLLSGRRELFDLLFSPPKPGAKEGAKEGEKGTKAEKKENKP